MSLKRKLTQDDLRKAMSEHKKKIGAVKKIESPLAKYPFYCGFIYFNIKFFYIVRFALYCFNFCFIITKFR